MASLKKFSVMSDARATQRHRTRSILRGIVRKARLAAVLVAPAIAAPALGQSPQLPPGQIDDQLETIGETQTDAEKKANPDLLIVPIPQSSPTLGSGLTLAAALFYNPNESKEPWVTGIGVMKTSNGSMVVGALHKMTLGDDRFRIGLFGGYGDVNMRFYGVGASAGSRDTSIELNEKGILATVHGQMRVAGNLYAGGRLMHLGLSTSINREDPLFPEVEVPLRQFDSKLSKLGPVITYDSRDSSLYPRNGEVADIVWLFGAKALGSDFSHNKLTIDGNIYRSLSKNTVIAARAAACAVSSGAPFYDLCFYGASSDLRGYETGRFRDRATWATQVELRQMLFGRFGAVVFAGIGGSAPKWSDIGDGKILPSAGAGIRFQPSRDTPINLRIDYARGRDSSALYIGIGEAF